MQASIICNRCNNVVLYDTDWNSSHICCPFCRNAIALSPASVNFQGEAAAPQTVNNFTQNRQSMPYQVPTNNQPGFNAQSNQYVSGQPAGEDHQQYSNNGEYNEYVENSSPNPVYWLLLLLGYGCYIFAVIDCCGMFFHYDITGVPWSPIVASVVGGILHKIAGAED